MIRVESFKSTIEYDIAGLRCFAREQFESQRKTGYYSDTLIYTAFMGTGTLKGGTK